MRLLDRLLVAAATTLALAASAAAQTTGSGPYYAVPSWDQTLPANTRFVILSNLQSQAFLDRETGVVWQRQFPNLPSLWAAASASCVGAEIGGRRGWRLPSIQELTSLLDTTTPINSLFTNFPQNPVGITVGSSTRRPDEADFPYPIYWGVDIYGNGPFDVRTISFGGAGASFYPICVRTGSGESVQ